MNNTLKIIKYLEGLRLRGYTLDSAIANLNFIVGISNKVKDGINPDDLLDFILVDSFK